MACCSAVALYGPGYFEVWPSASYGMSRYAIAYVGPWLMTSVANVRETP
jgi:hypothetical protein